MQVPKNWEIIPGGDLGALAALGSTSLGKLVHEQLALQLTLSRDHTRKDVTDCSWFFFELMIKAMVEHLATANTLHAPRKHRLVSDRLEEDTLDDIYWSRFSEQFNDDILNMVASLTSEILSQHTKQKVDKAIFLISWHSLYGCFDIQEKMVQLNACLAFFLHDLLSVMDRGYVFTLIRTYMKDLSSRWCFFYSCNIWVE